MKANIKIVCLLFLLFQINLYAQYDSGSGTSEDPYIIKTTTQLEHLSASSGDWSKHFKLGNNINMSGQSFTPIGNSTTYFSGTFEGNNYIISNLTITPNGNNIGTGFIGALTGSINRLGINNISITASGTNNRIGGIVGFTEGNASVTHCYTKGGAIIANGSGWLGGIVGVMMVGGTQKVQDCYSSTAITANWGSGGIVGSIRGQHTINRVAFYGSISGANQAITTVQTGNSQKDGIPPTNAYYAASTGATDAHATALNTVQLLNSASYNTFDFNNIWEIDSMLNYAIIKSSISDPELSFFEKIKTERVTSDQNVEWINFAPGTSGYCEEFWCHPTDVNVMFSGPDMHASFGTWDGGQTWQTLKDYDGSGLDMRRVIDIQFSTQNPDYGIAFSSNQTSTNTRGEIYETNDRGRSWAPVSNMGPVHSKLAIHPTNDNIWFLGAGDFWNVKNVRRNLANPHGQKQSRASYGYVWKTINKGATWTKVATNLSNDLDVGRIIFNPNSPQNMIMATSHGVFISSDTGETWIASSAGLPNNLPRDLTSHFDASTGNFTLFLVEQTVFTANGTAINSTGGIYKSTDNGANWINITGNLGIDFTTITDWSARDRYHRSLGYWFGIGTNTSKSTYTTYPSNVLSVFNRIVVNPLNKNEIYISQNTKHDYGFGPGDIWKTENGGATWFPCARNGAYWLSNSNTGYWNTKTGLSTTTANMDFSHVQTEMNELKEIQGARALAINANGDVFTVIAQQTFKTNNNGDSWEQIDDFETNTGSNKWIGRGNNALPGRFMLLETGMQDRKLLCSGEHGLWQTTNLDGWSNTEAVVIEQIEGQTFDTGGYKSAHSISTVAVHPNNPNTIYTLVDRQTHRGKVRKSTDGGQTWTNIATIFDADSNISSSVAHQRSFLIDPVTPNNMYFIAVNRNVRGVGGTGPGPTLTQGEYGIYRSNDGGYTWSVNNPNPQSNASVSEIAMHPDNPQTIFASLNFPGALYKSVDGAVNWTQMSIPSEIESINDIFIDRNTKHMFLSAGSRSGTLNAGGVWRSTDDGANWERIFEAPFIWQTETSPVNANIILISAAAQIYSMIDNFKNPGAYLSLDAGVTWKKINKGLAHADRIVDLKPDPYDQNIIWSAGWGSGWYKAIINTTSLSADENSIEYNKTIKIYPNPVKTGSFKIANIKGDAKYSIWSIQGKKIQEGITSNNKMIFVTGLNTGLYIVKISTSTEISTLKVLIN